MLIVIIATIVFAILAQNAVTSFQLPKWIITLVLFVIGIGLYILSSNLNFNFINNRAPQFIDPQTGRIDTRARSVVPRWVSHLTSISFAAVLSAFIPWIIGFFRWLF